ncbi:MAG: hypothetical protein E6R04_01765 [Spirochaetes bacterium]|nr:MAG: hypothetical protein E6R04_01765 [Spirochaetota bacterium]
MFKILLALIVVFLGFCAGCPTRTGLTDATITAPVGYVCPPRNITVGIHPQFTAHERFLIGMAVNDLKHLNVFGRVVEGESDIVIRHWTFNCETLILGSYTSETNYALVDPRCSTTDQQFRAVVVHELGHWLGMRHVCRPDGKTTDVCSPVGRGEAVMNPNTSVNQVSIPNRLDIAEYNRVCWIRARGW